MLVEFLSSIYQYQRLTTIHHHSMTIHSSLVSLNHSQTSLIIINHHTLTLPNLWLLPPVVGSSWTKAPRPCLFPEALPGQAMFGQSSLCTVLTTQPYISDAEVYNQWLSLAVEGTAKYDAMFLTVVIYIQLWIKISGNIKKKFDVRFATIPPISGGKTPHYRVVNPTNAPRSIGWRL